MRIRVNQYCLEPSAEWEKFKKDNAKYIERVKEYPVRRAKGGICLQCGTELFGDWHYSKIASVSYKKTFFANTGNEIENIPYQEKTRGEKLLAYLKEQDSLGEEEEHDAYGKGKGVVCPICGNRTELPGFDSAGRTPDGAIKDAYTSLQTHHRMFDIRGRMKELTEAFDIPVPVLPEEISHFDKQNTDHLKKYIGHLLQLETNILSLQKNLSSLYLAHFMNRIEVNRVNYAPMIEAKAHKDQLAEQYAAAEEKKNALMRHVGTVKAAKPAPYRIPEPRKPAAPVCLTPGLFNKKKIAEQNAALEAQYRQALKEYERLCQKRIAEMEQQNRANEEHYLNKLAQAEKEVENQQKELDAIRKAIDTYPIGEPLAVCPAKAKQLLLTEEISQAEALLKKTYRARNQLYAADIVFGKYRDIVALATFYEYLMAGRCTALEGANGAYNLYESEIRANLIISKLTDIEKSLKKIEQSQYMICSQLAEMNRTLTQMNDTMEAAYFAMGDIQADTKDMREYMAQISGNTKVMAHNTAVTAYYAKLNAELTDALGFMVALKS